MKTVYIEHLEYKDHMEEYNKDCCRFIVILSVFFLPESILRLATLQDCTSEENGIANMCVKFTNIVYP